MSRRRSPFALGAEPPSASQGTTLWDGGVSHTPVAVPRCTRVAQGNCIVTRSIVGGLVIGIER